MILTIVIGVVGLYVGAGIGVAAMCLFLKVGKDSDRADKEPIKTNYDLVRNMSLDDMAMIIMCPYDCEFECEDKDSICFRCALNWLKSEVEE